MNLNALTRPFEPKEVAQFQGRGGKSYDYVEDESVMDRLDEAVGIGNWQVQTEAVPTYPGVVKVRLGVRLDGEWSWYEDFGYPNNGTDGEALKEAVSDGIRRCGRYLGIARDLYRKHTTHAGQGSSSPRPAVSAPRPTASPPSAGAVPEEPEYLRDAIEPPQRLRTAREADEQAEGAFCPIHGLAWQLRPGGVSKTTGKAYDAFFACPSNDRPFCKEKPGKRWLALQEVA